MKELSNEELLYKYNKNIQEQKEIEEDTRITRQLLDDKYVDYMQRREYQNDIIANGFAITKLEEEMKVLMELAAIRGVSLNSMVHNKEKSNKKVMCKTK